MARVITIRERANAEKDFEMIRWLLHRLFMDYSIKEEPKDE